MKYQVVLNNTQVLSSHKREDLAEKAMKRHMKKNAHGKVIGNFFVSGIYHIRSIEVSK